MKFTIFLLLFSLNFNLIAQDPFYIALEPMSIPELGGIQSYAYAQHDGKWLIVGGRLDGLHRRQPWAAFDVAGHNTQMIVVDPVAGLKWTCDLTSLPLALQDQLSSTNMQFEQDGDYLYLVGGYGYSQIVNDHITYPNLSAIHVADLMTAIINGTGIDSYIRQVVDQGFAVTGGHLDKLYGTYYLTGGQRFDGAYNPMGMPTFTQTYTNAIRKFNIIDNGSVISITHLNGFQDSLLLHRRDFNVVSQIFPNGDNGLTAFSGVFQITADIPYLNAVNIDSNSYNEASSFSQYYNHYHCAYLPLYSEDNNEMHTVFFGGIAQYYESDGNLIQDNNVPFVKTIARVTRDASNQLTEYKMPIEMPSFIGASSELIKNKNLAHYDNGIIKLDSIIDDSVLVGYIYGGIKSSARNIFFTNDGTQSSTENQIYKVYLLKDDPLSIDKINEQSNSNFKMQLYYNTELKSLEIGYNIIEKEDVEIRIYTLDGRCIHESKVNANELLFGKNTHSVDLKNALSNGMLIININYKGERITQKISY